MKTPDLQTILSFLQVETPQSWVDKACRVENIPILLGDHLMCELKAAQSAAQLLRRYYLNSHQSQKIKQWLLPYEDYAYRQSLDFESLKAHHKQRKRVLLQDTNSQQSPFVQKMLLLIKEELHHFYRVVKIMKQRSIPQQNIAASRYARGLLREMKTHEPAILIDKLICGAFIEARSCERFAKIAPYLDSDLQRFYLSLLRSEARHFEDYLSTARSIAKADISTRIAFFRTIENQLITSEDSDFKFHSGAPCD